MRFRNIPIMVILLILSFPPAVVFSGTQFNPEKHCGECNACLLVPIVQIPDDFVPVVKGDPPTI
ncbi:MAG: hypothetical protein R6V04_05080 [bacterium]